MRTLLLAALLAAPAFAENESKAVLAPVQAVMDGLAAHDAERIKAAFTPDGRVVLVAGDKVVFNVTADEFAQRVTTNKEAEVLERLRNPQVQIRGRIAAVWSEYDFLRSGKLSHCGIDAFLLLKGDDGAWKILSIESTVEREGCPATTQ